jgi:hypothetical protein
VKIVGNKIYDVCPTCGKIIRINKTILGSLHICPELVGSPQDIEYYQRVEIPRLRKKLEES